MYSGWFKIKLWLILWADILLKYDLQYKKSLLI